MLIHFYIKFVGYLMPLLNIVKNPKSMTDVLLLIFGSMFQNLVLWDYFQKLVALMNNK